MNTPHWITNDPAAAKALKAADKAHDKARAFAAHLPLADKIIAYREAKEARAAAYDKLR